MVTVPQVSEPLAMPVLSGVVSAGHSRTLSPGQAMLGLVVSTTSICCTHVEKLLHSSVAVQVPKIVLVPPQPGVTASSEVMVTVPQVSEPVAMPVLAGVVSAGHSRTLSPGQAMLGLVVSTTSIFCTQVEKLLHSSVAFQVRRIVLVPPQPGV